MWLLELHLSVSILCLITFFGFRKVFREVYKENGYGTKEEKKKNITSIFIFLVPILNVIAVLALFVSLTISKDEFDKYCEDRKREKESRE